MMHNNSILAASQSIKTAEHNISLAKSGYIPRLSFNAGIGSSYYTVGGYVNDPFSAQMKHNFSTYVGVSLSIPILMRFPPATLSDRQNSSTFPHSCSSTNSQRISTKRYNWLITKRAAPVRNISHHCPHSKKHVARLRQLKKNTISGVQLRLNSSKPKITSSESKSARYNHIMNTFYATVY